MKLLPILYISTFVLTASCRAHEVSIRAVDENKQVVENARVILSFTRPRSGTSRAHEGKTDSNGRFSARDEYVMGVWAKVSREGYYDYVNHDRLRRDDQKVTVTLRRKKNPIALYVREVDLEIPVKDDWIGFDFEAGDWVAPHGTGKSRDMLFRFDHEFMGYKYSGERLKKSLEISKRAYAARKEEWTEEKFKLRSGKWDATLEIGFGNDEGGIIEETERYLPYSEMRLPHLAPETGYKNTLTFKETTYTPPNRKPATGYFVRTRVGQSASSKTSRANYAKILEDFKINARGKVSFLYYFNPNENDRNLEFDPLKNLAPDQKRRRYRP